MHLIHRAPKGLKQRGRKQPDLLEETEAHKHPPQLLLRSMPDKGEAEEMEKTYKGSGQSMIPCPTILRVSLVLIRLQLPPLWHTVPSTSNLVTLSPPQGIGLFI